ncbi:hypothetical protein L208DRAFT_1459577 [Tricholoma matsutake]|nr:hypothetical protein L208DRAFT_1459577 [Tricholoma matsutake 945]
MKVAKSLLFCASIALTTVPFVVGSFTIFKTQSAVLPYTIAVGDNVVSQLCQITNYYNDPNVSLVEGDVIIGTLVRVKSPVCGQNVQLNIYKRDQTSWDVYVNGGNGNKLGTCSAGLGVTYCPGAEWTTLLHCSGFC